MALLSVLTTQLRLDLGFSANALPRPDKNPLVSPAAIRSASMLPRSTPLLAASCCSYMRWRFSRSLTAASFLSLSAKASSRARSRLGRKSCALEVPASLARLRKRFTSASACSSSLERRSDTASSALASSTRLRNATILVSSPACPKRSIKSGAVSLCASGKFACAAIAVSKAASARKTLPSKRFCSLFSLSMFCW